MKNLLMHLWKEEGGQDLIEYALLIALVGLGAIAGINGLAAAVGSVFSNVTTQLTSAT